MLPEATLEDASRLLDELKHRNWTIATAESCTGGLISAALTSVPGCSSCVVAGFVTYSNDAKNSMLDVPAEMIESVGAVSQEVARRMVEGALRHSGADIAVSCTGVAGPTGGSAEKPVGLVHMAAGRAGGEVIARHRVFPGDRTAIRAATVAETFALVRELLER